MTEYFTIKIVDNNNDIRTRSYSLEKAQNGIQIGRHKSNDIILPSPMVSNFHCLIKVIENSETHQKVIEVKDTSSNGTQYNGKDIGKGNSVKINFDEKIVINMAVNDFHNITFSMGMKEAQSDIVIFGMEKELYSKYNIIQRLGDGQYSKVYKALTLPSHEIVALKILHQPRDKFQLDDVSKRELDIMKILDHPNIVRFRDLIQTSHHIILEVDYCEGGDLFTRMVSTGRMDEREASYVFHQLLEGVHYLHKNNVIHRDIKPENILLKENKAYPTVKIADFGMAKLSEFGSTACGTTQYAAPEVILPQPSPLKYSKECDIWSLGIILFILLSGTHPFSMDNENLLYKQMKEGTVDFKNELWNSVGKEPKEMISNMIKVLPKEREKIEVMLENKWFERNSIYWPEETKRKSEFSVPDAKRTLLLDEK